MAGEYSTTRPPMRLGSLGNYNFINTKLQLHDVTSVHKNPRCVSFRLGSASSKTNRTNSVLVQYSWPKMQPIRTDEITGFWSYLSSVMYPCLIVPISFSDVECFFKAHCRQMLWLFDYLCLCMRWWRFSAIQIDRGILSRQRSETE